jgi:uncharacterized protein involved in propanediol utilization
LPLPHATTLATSTTTINATATALAIALARRLEVAEQRGKILKKIHSCVLN